MTETPQAPAASLPSLPARFFGILFSPRETFTAVVANPKWFGMVAVTAVITALGMYLFLSTEVGQQAVVDQQVSTMESFGRQVNDEAYAAIEQQAQYAKYINPATILVVSPIMVAIIAGVLLGIFNAALGGDASFKKMLAVVAHAGPVSVVQQLFSLPINYMRGSASSPTNLSVFFPMVSDEGFFGSLLGTIDLFLLWWVAVLAIGLSVLYRRPTRGMLIGLLIIYAVIALAIAGVKAAMGGS